MTFSASVFAVIMVAAIFIIVELKPPYFGLILFVMLIVQAIGAILLLIFVDKTFSKRFKTQYRYR